jgi:hypothetical protein
LRGPSRDEPASGGEHKSFMLPLGYFRSAPQGRSWRELYYYQHMTPAEACRQGVPARTESWTGPPIDTPPHDIHSGYLSGPVGYLSGPVGYLSDPAKGTAVPCMQWGGGRPVQRGRQAARGEGTSPPWARPSRTRREPPPSLPSPESIPFKNMSFNRQNSVWPLSTDQADQS